jgi:uracil-DNA glycosylase family 4
MTPKEYKQALLDKLYAPYQNCTMCPLGTLGRTSVVFGEGNPDAELMFIGEGPGRDEDTQGRPFIGRSGMLLTKTLEGLGIARQDVFIANIVKCRPPNNRVPTATESSTCMGLFLFNQIKIIRPRIICTLGSTALQSLLGPDMKITKVRGTCLQWQNISLVPTYHPAYILRNAAELKTFIKDLNFITTLLNPQQQ